MNKVPENRAVHTGDAPEQLSDAAPVSRLHPRAVRRDQWRDAIWESDLTTSERITALCYADHAGRDQGGIWVAPERGTARTGLSLRAWRYAVASLLRKGWLQVHTPGKRGTNGKAARYWLTLPEAVQAPVDNPSDTPSNVQGVHIEGAPGAYLPGSKGAPGAHEPLPRTPNSTPPPRVAEPSGPAPVAHGSSRGGGSAPEREPARLDAGWMPADPTGPSQQKAAKRTEGGDSAHRVASARGVSLDVAREAIRRCEADESIGRPDRALEAGVPAALRYLDAVKAEHSRRRAEERRAVEEAAWRRQVAEMKANASKDPKAAAARARAAVLGQAAAVGS